MVEHRTAGQAAAVSCRLFNEVSGCVQIVAKQEKKGLSDFILFLKGKRTAF